MGRQKSRRSRPRVRVPDGGAAVPQTAEPVPAWHARLVENLRGVLADPDVPWSSKRVAVANVATTGPRQSSKIGDTLRMIRQLEQARELALAGRVDEADALMDADPSPSLGAVAAFLAVHDDDAIRQWAERLCPGALAAAGTSGPAETL